jgi:transcriptional regulator with XRE-family HTH domain/tetratricopeptide (TPR) repeat protein
VSGNDSAPLPAEAWRDPHMIRAWRTRDFRAVFHLACRHGMKPDGIASAIGLPVDQVISVMRGNQTLDPARQAESVASGLKMPNGARDATGVPLANAARAVPVLATLASRPQRERRTDHPGVRIAGLRSELGWSQEYLAERAGVSVPTINKLERQERNPSLEMMRKIASALGVAVADIMDPLSLEKPGGKRARLPDYLPDEMLAQPDFIEACRARDLGKIFNAAVATGLTASHLARRCEMTVGQVTAYMRHGRQASEVAVFNRVSDGLHIPGNMLGIAPRPWENSPVILSGRQSANVNPARSIDAEIVSYGDARTSISAVVQESTTGAAGLIMSAGKESIDPLSIEQSFEEVRRLLVDYTSASGADRQVLQRATALRDSLQMMTGAYRKPSQSSDLYLMIGLLSGICSYVCLDLGYADEAMTQARATFMMGDFAGHDGLRAWALGTRALIARFQENYPEALGYVREGLQYATSGTALVRLRCGEGQTLAHMGDAENAIRFLRLAKDAREQVSSTDIANGIFTFTEAKQAYYSGSSLQWLPDEENAKAAESESMQAIRMFQQAPPENRAIADELLAHVYLGNSRLTLGEIDGSIEALRPVLDLPLHARSAWHRKRMRQIARRLEREKFSSSRLAISAREEVSAFIEITE